MANLASEELIVPQHSESGWRTAYQAEIDQAERARQAGNPGMARVCARRAAGHVIRAYLERQGIPAHGFSAYDHLRQLVYLPEISPEIRQKAEFFLLRVTPEHQLPVEVDLIALARELYATLHPTSAG